MKSKILFILFAMASAGVAAAQSKIDLSGQRIIAQERAAMKLMAADNADKLIAVIIKPAADSCLDDLRALGVEGEDLGVTIVAEVPLSLIERVADLESVHYVTVSQSMEATMNLARPASGVAEAHEGILHDGATRAYDGSGVVAGLYDSGMDANHVNFMGADGVSRVKRIWLYNATIPKEYSPESRYNKIANYEPDTQLSSHATHVAGIMAGSYRGEGTLASSATPNPTSSQLTDGNIPFYGVATGADLAFSVGDLHEDKILSGINKIISYARSQNMPAVINLSLGTTKGPHDGSDSFSEQLAYYGQRAIICIASGNEGDIPSSIVEELGEGKPMRTFFEANKCESGVIDIWSNDSIPLTVSIGLYNMVTGQLSTLCSVSEAGQAASLSNANASFASNFTGSLSLASEVNRLNKRYHAEIAGTFEPIVSNRSKLLTLIVEGKDGKTVYIYGNAKVSFTAEGVAGYTAGRTDNSLNNAACADNIISVGSYTTRLRWGLLGGGTATYVGDYSLGELSPFSGRGRSFQGKYFPAVCAPGDAIISSVSRYWVNQTGKASTMSARAYSSDGITNYWGGMQGTSMACPYVTGTIALWLQACPTLTYDQVMEVIRNTSTIPDGTAHAAAWGSGKIDAAKGLQYILKNLAATGAVWDDDEQRLVMTPSAAGYTVVLAGEASFGVTVYDLQGRPVAQAAGSDSVAEIDTSALGSGVYVVRVSSKSASLSRKIAVR